MTHLISQTTSSFVSIVKNPNRQLSAIVTGTATILRQPGKIVAAISTGTITLLKVAGRNLGGVIAPGSTVTIIKTANRIINGTANGLPVIIKSGAARTVSAVAAGVGSVIKQAMNIRVAVATGFASLKLQENKLVALLSVPVTALRQLTPQKLSSTVSTGVASVRRDLTVIKSLSSNAVIVVRLSLQRLLALVSIPVPAKTLLMQTQRTAVAIGIASSLRRLGRNLSAASTAFGSVVATRSKLISVVVIGTAQVFWSAFHRLVGRLKVTGSNNRHRTRKDE